MINGRRIDPEHMLGQARALWQARTERMADSRTSYLLSRLTLLALFASIVSTSSELPTLTVREVPAIVFPFVIVLVVALWSRRINVHVNRNGSPDIALPMHAAPLIQRASLHITAMLTRARVFLATAPLPHIDFEGSEAVRVITLFAQRMSRSWLELCTVLESMVRLAACYAHQAHDLIASALPIVICRVTALDRTPQVTILRC